MKLRNRQLAGFTLIEVLVVVAIIALLISILLPSLNKARDISRGTVCRSNQRQLMVGTLMYVSEYKCLPASLATFVYRGVSPVPNGYTWQGLGTVSELDPSDLNWIAKFARIVPQHGTLYQQVRNRGPYVCPQDPDGTKSLSYSMNGYIGYKTPESMRFTYVDKFVGSGGISMKAGDKMDWSNGANMPVFFEEEPSQSINRVGSAGRGDGSMTNTEKMAVRHQLEAKAGRTNVAYLDSHVDGQLIKLVGDDPAGVYLAFEKARQPYKIMSGISVGGSPPMDAGVLQPAGANVDAFLAKVNVTSLQQRQF